MRQKMIKDIHSPLVVIDSAKASLLFRTMYSSGYHAISKLLCRVFSTIETLDFFCLFWYVSAAI